MIFEIVKSGLYLFLGYSKCLYVEETKPIIIYILQVFDKDLLGCWLVSSRTRGQCGAAVTCVQSIIQAQNGDR